MGDLASSSEFIDQIAGIDSKACHINQADKDNNINALTDITKHLYKKSLKRKFNKLKNAYENNEEDVEGLAVAAFNMILSLYKNTNSVELIKNLVGDKGMMVMGEIFGINRSFSSLQDREQLPALRFAGSSWGEMKRFPPLQRFLRYQKIHNPSIYIDRGIDNYEMFGVLPSGLPENFRGGVIW
jgi:hypothetical protein